MGFFIPESVAHPRKAMTEEERVVKKRIYNQRPERKAARVAYRKRPEAKAKKREYRKRPEVKARRNAYARKRNQTPEAKAKANEYMKEYRKRPKAKAWINEYMKAYSKQPKAKARINEYMNAYHKRRKQSDPLFKLKTNLRARVLKALEVYSKTGKILKSKQYGINYAKIIKHLGKPPACAFDVHHIVPLCCFDFNDLKAIERAFAPENHAYTGIKEHEELHADLIKYGVQ